MPAVLKKELSRIARGNLFKREGARPATGTYVGRPFALSYDRALLLVADKRKQDAGGLPQGAFLLAYHVVPAAEVVPAVVPGRQAPRHDRVTHRVPR
jgi:hypothetical protein